jgi:hypothetical protein
MRCVHMHVDHWAVDGGKAYQWRCKGELRIRIGSARRLCLLHHLVGFRRKPLACGHKQVPWIEAAADGAASDE